MEALNAAEGPMWLKHTRNIYSDIEFLTGHTKLNRFNL